MRVKTTEQYEAPLGVATIKKNSLNRTAQQDPTEQIELGKQMARAKRKKTPKSGPKPVLK